MDNNQWYNCKNKKQNNFKNLEDNINNESGKNNPSNVLGNQFNKIYL